MSAGVAFRNWYENLFTSDPWTNVYALGRSLLALSPLLTLVFNPANVLFAPNAEWEAPKCGGWIAEVGLFCASPSLELARVVGILVLALVVIGWRPRWTAIPHAWVVLSMQNSMTLTEGGDQIAGNLALLLLPIALADGRRWHWSPAVGSDGGGQGGETSRMVANTTMVLVRLQVAVIYLHAAAGKLAVSEWLDGTAVYYWMLDPQFGPDGVREFVLTAFTATAWGVTAVTWGAIVIEFTLAAGLVAGAPMRKVLFWVGILFHLGIAVALGLATFGVTMAGALVLFLWPRGEQPRLWEIPERVRERVRRRDDEPRADRLARERT